MNERSKMRRLTLSNLKRTLEFILKYYLPDFTIYLVKASFNFTVWPSVGNTGLRDLVLAEAFF